MDDQLWQLEEVRTKRIIERTEADLWRQYAEHTLRFLPATNSPHSTHRAGNADGGVPYRDISDAAWERARIRLQYVRAIMDLPCTQRMVATVIDQVWAQRKAANVAAADEPPSPATVLRWKARYLSADKDIHALLEQTEKKGNREPRYGDEVVHLVKEALDLTYLTRERKTLQDALDKAMVLVEQENQVRPTGFQLPYPTRRLMKRVLDDIPAQERMAARYGRHAAYVASRATSGHVVTSAPLARAEIDHTILDLFAIDDITCWPLGRCYFTACIDVHTRSILGIYLGFHPPSVLTVAHCLKHAFLPKHDLRQEYPDIQHEWHAHGVMRELVVDNGYEFHSKSLETACLSLGVEIHYSPRKTPWFKPHIERFFRSFNQGVAHGNPGTTFSNIFDKNDYDPSKHAIVRLSTLHQMVRRWIVDYYHQKPHRALGMSPAVMWANSAASDHIRVPDSPIYLDTIFGRSESRMLTHKGIQVGNLLYNSPELTALRAKLGEKLEVDVRIDDANLGHVVVISEGTQRAYKVPALDFDYANGLSLWQHQICQKYATDNIPRVVGMPAWVEAKEAISQLVERDFKWAKTSSKAKVARHQEHTRGLGRAPSTTNLPRPESPVPPIGDQQAEVLPAPPSTLDASVTDIAPKAFPSRHRDRSRQACAMVDFTETAQ